MLNYLQWGTLSECPKYQHLAWLPLKETKDLPEDFFTKAYTISA